eukprot:scaffold4545_cov111-Isochrysis_galbana.AAC.6
MERIATDAGADQRSPRSGSPALPASPLPRLFEPHPCGTVRHTAADARRAVKRMASKASPDGHSSSSTYGSGAAAA